LVTPLLIQYDFAKTKVSIWKMDQVSMIVIRY